MLSACAMDLLALVIPRPRLKGHALEIFRSLFAVGHCENAIDPEISAASRAFYCVSFQQKATVKNVS